MALFSTGILQLTGGDARGAAVTLAAALPHARALNDPLVPSVTNALGGAHDILGDLTAAMAQVPGGAGGFSQPRQPQRRGERAQQHREDLRPGRLATALEHYRMALPIWQEVTDVRREGTTLNNIGSRCPTPAMRARLDYFALAIERRCREGPGGEGHPQRWGSPNPGWGSTARRSRPRAGADAAAHRRRQAFRGVDNGLPRSDTPRLGDAQRAAACFEQALAPYQGTGDKRGEAVAIGDLAAAEAALKRYPEALEHARRALASLREIGDRSNTAGTLYLLARTARDSGDLTAAEGHVAEALNDRRGQRTGREPAAAHRLFLQSVRCRAASRRRADAAARGDPTAGHDVRALAVSERRGRAASSICSRKAAGDLRRGVDPQLLAREREVGAALGGKTARLLDLAARGSRTAEAETLATEVRALEAEHDAIDVKLRSASSAWAAMVQPVPLDVAAIQRNLLDPRTTLIEYALGEDAGYVWIVDRNRIRSARLPARAVVEAATRDVYDAVTARGRSVSGETGATRARADRRGRRRALRRWRRSRR